MNNETRDERLRRLLREADPADSGLTLDEAREMRRTVLSAVPERKRRLFPVFATAGAVLVAALILIAVLIPRSIPEKPPAPPQIAVIPPKAVQPPPPPREEPRLLEEKAEEKKTPVRRKRRAPVHSAPAEPEAVAVIAAAEPQQIEPQQIQFSTPGGTRIIWLLSPGDVSLQGE
jgi:hypothetical protein